MSDTTKLSTDATTKPQRRKLVRQAAGAVDKRRKPRGLTRKVKAAIDLMVFDAVPRLEACQRSGITERGIYLALGKVEVARYWGAAVAALRSGERAANVHALISVRDQHENRAAAVKAVQVLEQLSENQPPPGAPLQQRAGLVIVVVKQAEEVLPEPVTIDLPLVPAPDE